MSTDPKRTAEIEPLPQKKCQRCGTWTKLYALGQPCCSRCQPRATVTERRRLRRPPIGWRRVLEQLRPNPTPTDPLATRIKAVKEPNE